MAKFKIGFYSMFNRGIWDMEMPLFESFDVQVLVANEKSEKEFIAMLDTIDILIVSNNNITAKHIGMMKKCKMIARQGVGLDSIDVAAATAAGIIVCNVPGGSVAEVGDHSTALFASLARNIVFYNNNIKVDRRWDHQSMPPVKKMKEMILFLVGFGRIGQHVAERAAFLFGEIIVFDPWVSSEMADSMGVRKIETLEEGLKIADIVSLHLPFSESSKHMINRETLKLMKPDAYFVNMARGAHVDSDALNEALNNGVIAGAALDVLENELDAEKGDFTHPIYSNPKVILTPHVGWYGIESRRTARVVAAEAVADFMEGKDPRNRVN